MNATEILGYKDFRESAGDKYYASEKNDLMLRAWLTANGVDENSRGEGNIWFAAFGRLLVEGKLESGPTAEQKRLEREAKLSAKDKHDGLNSLAENPEQQTAEQKVLAEYFTAAGQLECIKFAKANPTCPINEQTRDILVRLIAANGLSWTAENLTTVFRAKKNLFIKAPVAAQGIPDFTQPATSENPEGVPSVLLAALSVADLKLFNRKRREHLDALRAEQRKGKISEEHLKESL